MSKKGIDLSDDEQLTRYIFSRSHFTPSSGRVKYHAYMPARNGETSVYRTSELSVEEIWDIGQKYVATPTERTLYAKGESLTVNIRTIGLDVAPETSVHSLHANIVDWPEDKDDQRMLAIEISNESKLTIASFEC